MKHKTPRDWFNTEPTGRVFLPFYDCPPPDIGKYDLSPKSTTLSGPYFGTGDQKLSVIAVSLFF